MKRLIFIFLILAATPLFGAGVSSITIPQNICPGQTKTFKVNYYILVSPYVNDVVYQITWEFSQNGAAPFLTKNSSDFVTGGIPFGEGTVTVSNLPMGNIKVKVTVKYLTITMAGTGRGDDSMAKTFTVGLSDPTVITGASNICNFFPSTYSISPITNATSYTWEVPAGWTVNGILGPVVTGQGNSVSIASCSGSAEVRSATVICAQDFSVHAIKVKAVTATCGQSTYATKSVTVNYPVKVTYADRSATSITLTATPSNLPSYNWVLPSSWVADKLTGPTIIVYHHSMSGSPVVNYTGNCSGNTYTASTYYSYAPPGGGGDDGGGGSGGCDDQLPVAAYPNTATNLLTVDNPCDDVPLSMQIEVNGSFKSIESSRDGNQYTIDVSSLEPGLHILRVKKAQGRDRYIRFMKSR